MVKKRKLFYVFPPTVSCYQKTTKIILPTKEKRKTFENLLCFEALINTESPLNVTMNFSLVTMKKIKLGGINFSYETFYFIYFIFLCSYKA